MLPLRINVLQLLLLLTTLLPAQDRGDLGENLTIDHFRGGFAFMANDHFALPGSRYLSPRPGAIQSWLDGVSRLKLSSKLEEEIVQFIKFSERNVHQYFYPAVPAQDQRWLIARFYELRKRDHEALRLYLDQDDLSSRELIALARLQSRNERTKDAKATFLKVTSWKDIRLEAHVYTALGESDELPLFLDQLRVNLPEATYIEHILPIELDLEFNAGQWQSAVKTNKQRGPHWHLRTLHYYGEFAQFQRSLQHYESSGTPPSLANLLLYPLAQTDRRIEARLLAGEGTRDERLRALRVLARYPTAIEAWIKKFPDEALDLSLELSPSFTPTTGKWENPITVFLKTQKTIPGTNPHLAKLVLVARPMEAAELLEFIGSSTCSESFPKISRISLRHFFDKIDNEDLCSPTRDPLLWILAAPRKYLPKEQVLTALESNPHFLSLSSAGKAKYYLCARLNHRLLNKLLEIDWSQGQHLALAGLANDNLFNNYLSEDQKYQKALWFTEVLAAYPGAQIKYRLERWAGDLETLELNPVQLQKIARAASLTLAHSLQKTATEVITDHLVKIKTGPLISVSISQLIPDTPAQLATEVKERLIRDRMIGGLLLQAAAPQSIPRADRSDYYGIWRNSLAGGPMDLSNRARSVRGIDYFEKRARKQWAKMGKQAWPELSENLRSHLSLPPTKSASSFIAHWLLSRLNLGRKVAGLAEAVEHWDGGLDHELRFYKAHTKQWNEANIAELRTLLSLYPPAYLKPGGRQTIGLSRPTVKVSPVLTREAARLHKNNTAPHQRPYQDEERETERLKQEEEREISEWLTRKVDEGRSLSSLARSFKIYREFSNFSSLEKLLKTLGSQITKSHPDRNWKEEVLTYLETIDPRELLEVSDSGPPFINDLATDPTYAQRYFDWAKGAGVPVVRTWGRIPQICIEKNQPEIAYQWIEFALTKDFQSFADAPPFGRRSRYHSGNSSQNSNVWTALAKSGHLTGTANKLLGRLQPDVDSEIKILLAATTNLLEWENLLAKLLTAGTLPGEETKYVKLPVFKLTHTLKYGKDAQTHLSKIHRILAGNPKLQSLADLEVLFMDPAESDRSTTIKALWEVNKSQVDLTATYNHRANELFTAALTEADTETFDLIMTDLEAGFSSLQWLSTWGDLLKSAPLADPARVHRLLEQLNRDEIYKRLRSSDQRGSNWWQYVSLIATAAYHANHAAVLQRILPDLTKHIQNPQKNTFHYRENDRDLHQLWAGIETERPLALQLARQGEQLSISWTLNGGKFEVGKNSWDLIYPGHIHSLDGRYDLTFTATLDDQTTRQILILKQVENFGTIKVPWDPRFENGHIEVIAKRTKDRLLLKAQRPVPSHELSTVEKPKHPGISQASFVGPFGGRNIWRGSYLGTSTDGYEVEIASWQPKLDHDFHLEFWLWRGSVRLVKPALVFYAQDSAILGTTELEAVSDGWFKIEHQLTPKEIPPDTARIALRFTPESGVFGFTPPQYVFSEGS